MAERLPQIPPRYRAIRRLGAGGSASVLLVEDRASEPRQKALKLLRGSPGAASIERLGREFEILARMRHPSLPAVYDFGVAGRAAYYTAEYIEGADLYAASEAWTLREVAASMVAACRVLAFLHAHDLLHNDVKPSNIVVGGAPDRLWLLDFGLAAPGHKAVPGRSGTLPYLPVERLEGGSPDARSDLYALGVSYYRALTRRYPVEAQTAADALSAQRKGIRPARAVRPDLPPTVEAVLMRLLAPRPDDRPASALEVIADLDRAGLGPFELETRDTLEAYVLSAAPAGHDQARARLREAAALAASGRPTVVWLLGESGAGKSRLLLDLAREWELRGAGSAAGVIACARPPGAPFGAALDLCRRALAVRSAGLPPAAASVLRRFVPDADLSGEPAPAISAAAERERLADAIGQTLALPAREAPWMLALDDAGWADDGSLHALQVLAASVARPAGPPLPLLLLLAGHGDEDLRRGGPALSPAAPWVVRVDVGPLSVAEVRQVVESSFGPRSASDGPLIDDLHRRSSGSPLLLVEILRALARQGAVRRTLDGFELASEPVRDLPPRLSELLRERVAALRGVERDLVLLLAVIGRPVRVPGDAPVARLRARGLLREEATGAALFHQTLADAALAELAASDLPALHLGAATLLAAEGAPADELAQHFDRAGRPAEAFGYLLAAGKRARAVGETGRATELLGRAAELGDDASATAAVRAELDAELGEAALARGDASNAEEHLRRALGRAGIAPRERRRCLVLSARAALARGDADAAERLLAEAGGDARVEPEEAAAAAAARARILVFRGRQDEARRTASEALAELRPTGAAPALAQELEAVICDASMYLSDFAEAEGAARRRLELSRKLADPLGEAFSEQDLVTLERYRGRPERSLEGNQRILDFFRRTGNVAAAYDILNAIAVNALDLGDPQKALALTDEASALAPEGTAWMPHARGYGGAIRGRALVHAGRLQEAKAVLARVAAEADAIGPERSAAGIVTLAEVCAQLGDAAGAEGAAAQLERMAAPARTPVMLSFSERARAHAHWARGDFAGAEAGLRSARARYERTGSRPGATHVLRQIGELLLSLHRGAEAQEILLRAAGEYAEMGNHTDAARCRALAGEALPASALAGLSDLRAALGAISTAAGLGARLQSLAAAALQLVRDLRYAAVYLGLEWDRPVAALGEPSGGAADALAELAARAFRTGEPLRGSGRGDEVVVPGLGRGVPVLCLYAQASTPLSAEDLTLLGLLADATAAATLVAPDRPPGGSPAGEPHTTPTAAAAKPRIDARALEITLGGIELRHGFPEIVGRSAPMRGMLGVLDRVVETEMPVLLVGETGTGKEIVARAVHENSRRAQGPFQALNCAAVAPSLAESELFGHRRGAFTGATADRTGVVQAAHQGTLFLDEIGEMDLGLQAKLLRTLEEGTVRPVGDTREQTVDFRLIAATHRDLPELIAAGRFRQDLYYRLSVMEIHLPPLRERAGDIPELIEHLLSRLAAEVDPAGGEGANVRIDAAAMELLSRYAWPGNVRELENELRRALVLAGTQGADATLGPQHLSRRLRDAVGKSAGGTAAGADGAPSASLHHQVRSLEVHAITEALQRSGGNKAQAARDLGLSYRGLAKKIARYRLGG